MNVLNEIGITDSNSRTFSAQKWPIFYPGFGAGQLVCGDRPARPLRFKDMYQSMLVAAIKSCQKNPSTPS